MVASALFVPGRKDEPLKPGLVLEVTQELPSVLLRITHVFNRAIYVMPVSTPNMARYAVRPLEQQRSNVARNLEAGNWRVGRLGLPQQFLDHPAVAEREQDPIKGAFSAIEPLVEQFDDERNLARSAFNVLINRRAVAFTCRKTTLTRRYREYFLQNKTIFLTFPKVSLSEIKGRIIQIANS